MLTLKQACISLICAYVTLTECATIEPKTNDKVINIVYPVDYATSEFLAAKEVRRYVYLRTDQLLPMKEASPLPESGDLILVGKYDSSMVSGLHDLINHNTTAGGFILKTVYSGDRNILVITGNDTSATLQAAYRFAEHLGCGFDLASDAVPDEKIPLSIKGYDEVAEPLLSPIGINPYHDFDTGPDLWQTDDYMAVIGQLPKMGMNFIGLHTYIGSKADGEGREPTTWIGLPEDVNPDGTVKQSYSSYYSHTHRPNLIWGTVEYGTSNYHCGASEIFPRDFYGSDVFGDTSMPT